MFQAQSPRTGHVRTWGNTQHMAQQARDPGATDADGWVSAPLLRTAVIEATRAEGAQAAADLIGRHWDRYATTAPADLLAAVRALPGEVFIDNAGMVIAANYLQHVVNGGEPHRFERDPHVAMTPEGTTGTIAEQLIGLTGTIATQRTRGEVVEAAEAAADARRRLDAAPEASIAPMRANLPHLFVQWGRALEVAGGDHHDAEFEYEEAYRLGLVTDQPQIARRAAGHLAWYHAVRGWLAAGEYWLERAAALGEPNPRYDAVLHLTAALIHLDRRNPGESWLELSRMEAHQIGEYWAPALWVKARHARTAAERALLEAEVVKEVDRHPAALVQSGMHERFLRATWMRLGHPVDAPKPTTANDHVLDAVREYGRGHYHRAIADAHPATGPTVPPRARANALIVTAGASLGLKRREAAAEAFELAYTLIEREQIYTAYELISPEHLKELADTAVGIEIPLHTPFETRSDTGALLAELTKRERQVLGMLASDHSMADIARELYISQNTLKATAQRLYRKLRVSSRAAAADIAQRAGLHVG